MERTRTGILRSAGDGDVRVAINGAHELVGAEDAERGDDRVDIAHRHRERRRIRHVSADPLGPRELRRRRRARLGRLAAAREGDGGVAPLQRLPHDPLAQVSRTPNYEKPLTEDHLCLAFFSSRRSCFWVRPPNWVFSSLRPAARSASAMLRAGKTAAAGAGVGDGGEPSSGSATARNAVPASASEPAPFWFSAPAVKVIFVALAFFFLVHLFMWYIVYGHMRDRFDENLRQSARVAWGKVKEVASHL